MIIENRDKLNNFQWDPPNLLVYSLIKLYLKYFAYWLSFKAAQAFLKIDRSHLWSLVIHFLPNADVLRPALLWNMIEERQRHHRPTTYHVI